MILEEAVTAGTGRSVGNDVVPWGSGFAGVVPPPFGAGICSALPGTGADMGAAAVPQPPQPLQPPQSEQPQSRWNQPRNLALNRAPQPHSSQPSLQPQSWLEAIRAE